MISSSLHRLVAGGAAIAAFATAPAFAQAAKPATTAPTAPQQITRAEVAQQVDAQFKSYDTNGDGKLTKAELDAVMAKALAAAQTQLREQMKADFDKIDTNHNGQISLAEFQAQQKLSVNPAKADARFKELDANKDGVVSAVEYRNETLSQFDKLDTNKDGVVSAAEAEAGGAGR